MSSLLLMVYQGARDGLTWKKLVSSLPTDPASIFTLVALFVSVGFVFWFGRPRGRKKSD